MNPLALVVLIAIAFVIWRSIKRRRSRPLMEPAELGRVLDQARRKAEERDPPEARLP